MNGNVYFLVEPLGGSNFIFEKNSIIVNLSIEDPSYINKIGYVKHLPKFYNGNVEIGDLLVVHHNTFRTYYDQDGNKKESFNHIKDVLFYVADEFIYMVIKPNGEKFSFKNNVFIKPILEKESMFEDEKEIKHVGEVYLSNDELIQNGIKKGDTVFFSKDSEYEFIIGDERLYKMTTNKILAKI